MEPSAEDRRVGASLARLGAEAGIPMGGASLRRTSSRFCLGVEHGDYNGTELFGVGTDRFLWFAHRPSGGGRVRLFSGNFPGDGVVAFRLDQVPPPRSPAVADSWARFPLGVAWVLGRAGLPLRTGLDGVLAGNIPGGGMSRSASLCINLILSLLEANGIEPESPFQVVEWAQQVENDYIGSPSGQLDQIMILFAREGMGTHYDPRSRRVEHVPLGPGGEDLRLVSLDTGTVRPGLEKATYPLRRAECEEMVRVARARGFGISCLADVADPALHAAIVGSCRADHPDLCDRLTYIHQAQGRFRPMLQAWREGDIVTVGRIFREDGRGLRDLYRISGPELETMCDIARTVPGVLGERMLGGGDKGAAGALVRAEAVAALQAAVDQAYPRSRPELQGRHAVHVLRVVPGVTRWPGLPA